MFFIHKRFRMLYNMHMKIGIYGGTFDPVHMGHIFVARSVKQELGLDRVDFVVAADPPHKHSAERTPAALRFDMVCAALKRERGMRASDIEIRRGGVSYTVDTLREMKRINKKAGLYFIVGADMLEDFSKWKNPKEILELAALVAVNRRGQERDIEALADGIRAEFGGRVEIISAEGPDISSTEIRRRVQNAQTVERLVPLSAEMLLYEKRLYQPKSIEQLAERVSNVLDEYRMRHTMLTVREAVGLAQYHGLSTEKARLAALLHDCAKLGREETVRYAEKMGYALTNEERENPFLIHSRIGALLARDLYGVQDTEILNAIERHTVGCAEMTPFDEVIFLADKLEPSRDYRRIRDLRELAFRDLDRATIAVLRNTIEYTENKGMRIHPQTEITIAALEKRVKARLHGGD